MSPPAAAPLDSQISLLKHQLHITPKTASLLIRAGYSDYTRLADVSPQHVSKQFQQLLNLSEKHAYSYKRALRQIVWLGTKEHPEKFEKDCRSWSDKALRAQGVWCEGFDALTGREIEERIQKSETKKPEKKKRGAGAK